jgi:hypothetical protein
MASKPISLASNGHCIDKDQTISSVPLSNASISQAVPSNRIFSGPSLDPLEQKLQNLVGLLARMAANEFLASIDAPETPTAGITCSQSNK